MIRKFVFLPADRPASREVNAKIGGFIMKLTETQKNFRKQMKQNKQKKDQIYSDNYNETTNIPNSERNKLTNSIIITVIVGAIIGVLYINNLNTDTLPVAGSPPVDITNDQVTNAGTNTGQLTDNLAAQLSAQKAALEKQTPKNKNFIYGTEKVLTYREGQALNSLKQSTIAVDDAIKKVNIYRGVPVAKDNAEYRNALLAAIVICSQEEQKLEAASIPEHFEFYRRLDINHVSCCKNAFKCWYDGILTGNSTLIERGNTYMQQANNINRQKLDEFENYLKDNGYKCIRIENEINYYYKSR